MTGSMCLGLRTAVYAVRDLDEAKAWYGAIFAIRPYFDQPFYVGFNVGGFELGLIPAEQGHAPGPGGVVAYWGVASARAAWEHLLARGAEAIAPVEDVGGGILTATVRDPFGNTLGIIENPHFPNTQ
jgi:predicted enzyme related to lactoylglutathione lyase